MALLKLDERSLTLNVIAGVLEEYLPSEKVKELSTKVSELKTKLEARQKEEEAFLKTEIIPTLTAIRAEIQNINETKYPELVELRKQQEAQAAAKSATNS